VTEIDAEAIRALARLLDETGLSEIEIADGDHRLRVARAAAPVIAAVPGAGPAEAVEPEPAADASHPGAVMAPMVGTAYLAPEPGAPPFVGVGDAVVEGQTLLIIEAMKVMNPIRAPRAGTVRRILIENGQPVEYGEVLLIVE